MAEPNKTVQPSAADLAEKLAQVEAKLAALEAAKAAPVAVAAPEADAPKAPEMRAGGEFVVNGVRVDANGVPLKGTFEVDGKTVDAHGNPVKDEPRKVEDDGK